MAETESSVTPDPTPPPAGPSVVLPSPPVPAPAPVVAPPNVAWLDWPLDAVVLILAFLMASFPVANPDFFRQLATGRLVSQGAYPFGSNPFVFSLDGHYWVNHSWLFGLLTYLLYQVGGGVVVVVVKALAVALVAELMLRCARPAKQSLWLPAVCTALALVTLSPHLSLGSRCASYLGLALVLWLLEQSRQNPRAAWLIPPVCLLWVNLDAWFWLGPLLVGLHLAGQLLERQTPQTSEAVRRSLGVLAASLAACLVNPYFPYCWRVFQLPPELSLSSYLSGLRDEELFRSHFLSPWNREYFDVHTGLSVAGIAYFVLLAAGLVSFLLDSRKLSAGRLLPWLVFALMSLWNYRLIPFFAIVAGPITAQGFLSWSEGLPRWTPAWRRWALAGRGLSLLAGLLLLVAAVPGWLQAEPHWRHRVGWGVEPNPSLEEAARTIQKWHKEGKLPPGQNWLSVTPDVAPYLAWYCPGERAWIDDSLLSDPEAAEEYLRLRQALRTGDRPGDDPSAREEADAYWQQLFRTKEVHLVLHYNVSTEPGLQDLLRRFLSRPREWAPCHLEGYATIFAWLDPNATPEWKERVAAVKVNVRHLAFGPEAKPAPPKGPDEEPTPAPWWEELWHAPPQTSLDRGTAALHELRFRAMRLVVLHEQDLEWQAMVPASAIGFAAQPGQIPPMTLATLGWSLAYKDYPFGGPPPQQVNLRPMEQMALQWRRFLAHQQDLGPPTSLYLGIRAARRALVVNPNDPYAHLLLGQAYYRLGWYTRERFLTQGLPQVTDLRLAQAAGAFTNVLRLQPDLTLQQQAHQLLADLFGEQGMLDLQTQHRREELRCARAAGPLPGEDEDTYSKRLQQLESQLTQMEAQLSRNENLFQVQAARRPLPERVQRALGLHLVETAYLELERDLQDHKDKDQPSPPPEIQQASQLKLVMGLVQDARYLLEPGIDQPNMQVWIAANPWPYVQLAAARGSYDEADRFLEQRLHALRGGRSVHDVGVLMANGLLSEAPAAAGMPGQQFRRLLALNNIPSADMQLLMACRITLDSLQEQAECHFFRGWLALEAGRTRFARQQLQLAQERMVPVERWGPLITAVVSKGVVLTRPDVLGQLTNLARRQEGLRRLTEVYLDYLNPRR